MTEYKLTERLKAHHDAGQAVVARVLGVSVDHATMFPAALGNGAAAQTNSAAWLARAAPLDAYLGAIATDAAVCIAGPIAQERYRARKNKKTPDAWADDIRRLQHMVARITLLKAGTIERDAADISVTLDQAAIDAANKLLDRLKEQTSALVAKHWPAIERVAQALLTSRVLYQEQIDVLVQTGGSDAESSAPSAA